MTALRRRLAGLVWVCLLWQAGVYAAATSVAGYAAAGDREKPACCRLHGPDHVCPMDKAPAARRSSTAARLLDPCCSPDTALLTLLGTVGLPSVSSWSPAADPSAARARRFPAPPETHGPIPNVPPPRR